MKPWELHPAMVHFPIALLLSGVVLDLYAWFRKRPDLSVIVSGLIIAGIISGVAAALAGGLAYFTVPAHTEAAHEKMYWHLGLELAMVALFAITIALRRRGGNLAPSLAARVSGLFAAAILLFASSLGGEMVYRGGAGVDPKLLAPEIAEGHSHGASSAHSHGDMSKPHGDHAHDDSDDKSTTHAHEEAHDSPARTSHDNSVEKLTEEHPNPIKQP